MSHVSSQDGLLSWGRTLVQRNRTGNPTTGTQWRGSASASAGAPATSGSTPPSAAGRPGSPAASQASASFPAAGGGGGTPSGRFADTAVEAEEPHWKRSGGGGTPQRSGAGSVVSAGGAAGSAGGGGASSVVGRPASQSFLNKQRVNRVRSPPIQPSGMGCRGATSPPPSSVISGTDGRGTPMSQAGTSQAGTDIQPPPGATSILQHRDAKAVEREKTRLLEQIRSEQEKADELHMMMERNEHSFSERQIELNDVLKQANLQRDVAARHPSMESSRAGSPQATGGGRVLTPALTATDRKIRALEEELWNAELALEKADREEAVCGAAIVRFADCIKNSEDRIKNLPQDLHGAIRIARDVKEIGLELRNVCLRTHGLNTAPTSAGAGGGYTPRKSILPQGKKKLVDLAPLPNDADLEALAPSSETYTECASKALDQFSKSLCLVLDECNVLRVDRLSGLQDALHVAENQVDRQSLVIDDAHETLSDLQQIGARRDEEILEAKFVLKTLAETRDSTSKRRGELQGAVGELEDDLHNAKTQHETQLNELRMLDQESAAARKEHERAQEESEASQKQVAANEAKARSQKNAADAADALRSKLKRELRSLGNTEEDLQREVKGLREKSRNLNEDSSRFDQQRASIQSEIDTHDIELRKTTRASDELEASIQELQRQGARVDRDVTGQKAEVAELVKVIADLKEQLEDTKVVITKHNKLAKDHTEDLELVNLVLTQHREEEAAHLHGSQSVSALSGTNMSATSAAGLAAAQQHEESRAALMMSPEIIHGSSAANNAANGHDQLANTGRSGGGASRGLAQDLEALENAAAQQASTRSQSDRTGSSSAAAAPGGRNIVQVQPAPSHYPPTVELLPNRHSHSLSPQQQQQDPSKGRTKRWGGQGSTERDVSEGGTSMSSALSTFYRNKELQSASPDRAGGGTFAAPAPGQVQPTHPSQEQKYQQPQQQQYQQAAPHPGQQQSHQVVGDGGGGRRALIDSDAPVGTVPVSPGHAPILVSMQPRHWNRQGADRSSGAQTGGSSSSRYAQDQQPHVAAGHQQHSGPLSVEDMRARINRYSRGGE